MTAISGYTEVVDVPLAGRYTKLRLTIGTTAAGGPGHGPDTIDIRADENQTPIFSGPVSQNNTPLHVGPVSVRGVQKLVISVVTPGLYDVAVVAGTVSP